MNKIIMQDYNLTTLLRRIEEKLAAGYDLINKVERDFKHGYIIWKVAMRKMK